MKRLRTRIIKKINKKKKCEQIRDMFENIYFNKKEGKNVFNCKLHNYFGAKMSILQIFSLKILKLHLRL